MKVSHMTEKDEEDENHQIVHKIKKKTQVHISKKPYGLSEDEKILKYVLISRRFDKMKGNSIWEEAEKMCA